MPDRPVQRGLSCPNPRCRSRARTVRFTKLPCPGVRIRYCRCSKCKTDYKTREVFVTTIAMSAAARK